MRTYILSQLTVEPLHPGTGYAFAHMGDSMDDRRVHPTWVRRKCVTHVAGAYAGNR